MSVGISINSDFTIAQPTAVTEGLKQKVHDNTSAKGVVRRIWLAQKRTVMLQWDFLTQAQYAAITGYFYGTGASITYTNTYSGVSITGFATAEEGPFIKGASMNRSLTVTIQEA
jgi:hypothetical protein